MFQALFWWISFRSVLFETLKQNIETKLESQEIVCIFVVDASRAGMGEIEVQVQAVNKKVAAKVINLGNDVYKVFFMPKDPVKHLVFVTFSKESVPGRSKNCFHNSRF